MKKHFLLVSLMMVVFLWLGNYTFASTCQEQDSDWTTSSNGTCPSWLIADGQDGSWNICCNPSPTTPTAWQPCALPDNLWGNSHVNSIGLCVCNDGWTKIKNVCTSCKDPWVCCGVELNTSVPFIGKCIEDSSSDVGGDETWVTWDQAFPVLMSSMMKILVTVILIVSFVLIIVGGIMIAVGNPSGGKKMIIKVAIGIALLGASGVILRLINPNFFG